MVENLWKLGTSGVKTEGLWKNLCENHQVLRQRSVSSLNPNPLHVTILVPAENLCERVSDTGGRRKIYNRPGKNKSIYIFLFLGRGFL